ncbi:DUF2309 domain-containing protein [soil metagenome]
MNVIERPIPETTQEHPMLEAARTACRRMAPLWPLQHFVAVNPFVGLSELPFVEACNLLRRLVPGGMQMPAAFYHEKFASGEILESDLDLAWRQAKKGLGETWAAAFAQLDRERLKTGMSGHLEVEVLTVAETVDRLHGTNWAGHIGEAIGQFCAGYYDAGQSAWRLPWQSLPLFSAWREMASRDANPEVLGLPNFRAWVLAMPDQAEAAIMTSLGKLGLSQPAAVDFLHKALLSIRGWAGYAQYVVRERGLQDCDDDSLLHLLAIRLAYDAALLEQFDSPSLRESWPTRTGPTDSPEVLSLFLWQVAHEHAWERELLGKLQASPKASFTGGRPAVQAVFCIDVRSEILRRALEAETPGIQTIGFAGFFGLPMEFVPFGERHGTSLCPVLLKPQYRVRERRRGGTPEKEEQALKRHRLGKRLNYSWNSFKSSSISCFSFVETAGLAFGVKLIRDAFAPGGNQGAGRPQDGAPQLEKEHASGIGPAERVALALGMLRNMGLTTNFARIVLLCGHGSDTTNNPYGSGLDCGACGGNAGDANARVGAAILNDPAVRCALAREGIGIPTDTHFLSGLHCTTSDQVTLFDLDEVPATHLDDLAELQNYLSRAGQTARRERAGLLGLDQANPRLDQAIHQRSRDWAQVRPEWGLAGNAAFIAAPRSRTRMAHLGGRVFLHDYDHRTDRGDATLELILIAPVVVASWINLQYYASTVNNAVFGSGNKVIHNVVGTLGVCQGNSGDLETGLPLQSLHDGTRWIHEPLRLHVLIEAPRERIATILEKHDGVRQLFDNGWLLLFAIEDDSYYRYRSGLPWDKIEASGMRTG